MLYNGSDVIRDVEWVIFDEVHYINDSEVHSVSPFSLSGLYFSVLLIQTMGTVQSNLKHVLTEVC